MVEQMDGTGFLTSSLSDHLIDTVSLIKT